MAKTLSKHDIAFFDLERELKVTRSVLEAVPEAHFGFKPHAKSMSLLQLADHVASLPVWHTMTLTQPGINFASPPSMPPQAKTSAELLATFDKCAAAIRKTAAAYDAEDLGNDWFIKKGDETLATKSKLFVYRIWCHNHLVHHRAQLCVYLRLLDVPVPTVYFNTADNPAFSFD